MIYRISTLAIAVRLCKASAFAFAPPQFTSHAKTFRLHSSLSDQLSQLSYDNAFIDKASRAVSKAVSTPPSAVDTIAETNNANVNVNVNVAFPDVSSLLHDIKGDIPKLPSDLALEAIIDKIHLPQINSDLLPATASLSLEAIDTFLHPIYSTVTSTLPFLATINAPPSLVILLTAIVTYSIIAGIFTIGSSPPPSTPYPMNKYDPVSARRYFDSRLFEVLFRGLQVTLLSGAFLTGLAFDWVRGQLEANADRRAEELSVLLTRLGPSFIKVRTLQVAPLENDVSQNCLRFQTKSQPLHHELRCRSLLILSHKSTYTDRTILVHPHRPPQPRIRPRTQNITRSGTPLFHRRS